MAGVSAACIAPPLITGFATFFLGKYFATNDRNAGLVNFILNQPTTDFIYYRRRYSFCCQNPLKVLPIMMFGSSIAAVLTYIFGYNSLLLMVDF